MSFRDPTLLAGLLLLLPVLIAFLVRRRRRVVEVPSVLRWRTVGRARHRAKRFRNLHRLLALLACVAAVWALVVAAAGPGGFGSAQTTWYVVDVSPSMGDREDGPLADAIDLLEQRIALRAPNAHIGIVTSGPEPERLAGPTTDGLLLDAAVARLARSARSDLRGALQLADRLAGDDATVVLLHDGGDADIAATAGLQHDVRSQLFGQGRENLGITALAARPMADAESDAAREVVVAVAAAGERARRARVRVEADGASLLDQPVEVPAGDEALVRVRLDLRASELVATVAPLDELGDDLRADDRATLALGATEPPRVQLQGGDADDGAHFFARRAIEASGAQVLDDAAEEPDVVVWLGAPSAREGRPTLILGAAPAESEAEGTPPAERWPRGVRGGAPMEGGATALRAVADAHPITRGVQLDGVTVLRARALELEGETRALVELDGGPVVAAGGEGHARFAALALEPGDSDVVLRVAYPLLVSNALAWLRGGAEQQRASTPTPAEVALRPPTMPATLTSAEALPSLPVPPLPVAFALLAALLLALEGWAYQRGLVR